MKHIIKSLVLSAAAAVVLAPMPARADGFFIPWVGSGFGNNIQDGRGTFGVSGGAMGAGGVVGGEVDFGWNPSFFGPSGQFGNNSVIDVIGNVIVGVPIGGTRGGGIRPYLVGGGGLIRTQFDQTTSPFNPVTSRNMFGWDAGGGVMGFFSDHVGLRGDLRYLRATHDINSGINSIDLKNNRLDFWRASIGVVFR
ncbi:MAG TPA: outer membrane beta-barrel protein [Vicinamibacterales bacterium]|nr:outer membrane beta-barrel protein [Vicinamibacterales bacterium]